MLFTDLPEVNGAFTVIPQRYQDNRGFFQEGYNSDKYEGKIKACSQLSFSKSKKNVIRGMHCAQYGKLVQCLQGSVIDYMVDLRPESSTYLKWTSVQLSADSPKQVYIPPRCGHGIFAGGRRAPRSRSAAEAIRQVWTDAPPGEDTARRLSSTASCPVCRQGRPAGRNLRRVGLHACVGPFAQRDLGGKAEDSQRPPCPSAHSGVGVVPRPSAQSDKGAVDGAGAEGARALWVLWHHR